MQHISTTTLQRKTKMKGEREKNTMKSAEEKNEERVFVNKKRKMFA